MVNGELNGSDAIQVVRNFYSSIVSTALQKRNLIDVANLFRSILMWRLFVKKIVQYYCMNALYRNMSLQFFKKSSLLVELAPLAYREYGK